MLQPHDTDHAKQSEPRRVSWTFHRTPDRGCLATLSHAGPISVSRDLDKEAEEFIVSWARELPCDRPLRIVVHLPEAQAALPEAREIGAAITSYFRRPS